MAIDPHNPDAFILDVPMVRNWLIQAFARAATRSKNHENGDELLTVPMPLRRGDDVVHWEDTQDFHCPEPGCHCHVMEMRSPCHPKAGFDIKIMQDTGIVELSCRRCGDIVTELALACRASDALTANVMENAAKELPDAKKDNDNRN